MKENTLLLLETNFFSCSCPIIPTYPKYCFVYVLFISRRYLTQSLEDQPSSWSSLNGNIRTFFNVEVSLQNRNLMRNCFNLRIFGQITLLYEKIENGKSLATVPLKGRRFHIIAAIVPIALSFPINCYQWIVIIIEQRYRVNG